MAEPFFRIPPFPGSRAEPLATLGKTPIDEEDAERLARLLCERRVGGQFWGARPELPEGRDLLLAPCSRRQGLKMLDAAEAAGLLGRCVMLAHEGLSVPRPEIPLLSGTNDWWHIVEQASEVWVDADHQIAFVAALAGRSLRTFGEGAFAGISEAEGIVRAVQHVIGGWAYNCPFGGDAISPVQVVGMLSEWRLLIDRNRRLSFIFGIAGWKRPTLDSMLWDGMDGPCYSTEGPTALGGNSVAAAWKSRTSPEVLNRAVEARLTVAEIEDGLIRGRGLGANCVPPLSVVVDFSGVYFDPSQPSDLEKILQSAELDQPLIDRAARLRTMIVDAGVSKYGGGTEPTVKSGSKRRVLVVGQVEDDRSILSGGSGQTNLELLQRARQIEPDAWLIYRPHPDVEAGHRKGYVSDRQLLAFADEIERGGSISALIDTIDELHCITSLAGFEALLRGKRVTTHGVPFYAGWGLTTDLGPVPPRRGRRRSLDELIAAALILYPTYMDPVTRLPCPPEILVQRIARGEDSVAAPLATLRALQGKLKVALRRLREAAA